MLGSQSYWKSGVTLYGAGQKKVFTDKARHGMDARVFVNKDSPDYKPSYGKTFTERQRRILNEEIPLDEIRANEIATIIHKAESLCDEEAMAIAKTLYPSITNRSIKAFVPSAIPFVTFLSTSK